MLGLHINALAPQHLEYIATVKPPVSLLLDPKPESVAAIKARHPGGKLIGRPYIRDADLHAAYLGGSPERAREAGARAATICLSYAAAMPQVDAWLLLNEPPVDSLEQIRLLAEFDSAFVRGMAAGGRRGMIGAFARGTPQVPAIDGGAALRAYAPALQAAVTAGAWLAIHQYGLFPLFLEHEWHVTRWQEQTIPGLQVLGLPKLPYVVTETGVDMNTTPGGWLATPYSLNPRDYAAHLQQLMEQYARDPLCLGACIYCAGDNGDSKWHSFMVDGPLLDMLAGMAWPKPAQPILPAPPAPISTPTKPEVPVSAIPAKPAHAWLPSPNFNPGNGRTISAIVYHHTGGGAQASLNWLRNTASGVSTHYLVSKAGKVYQLVTDDNIAWHAGYSRMLDGRENVNAFSIGIEIENAGDGKDPYPQAQIDAVVGLARYLAARHNVPRAGNVTHELIRRLWKERYPTRRDDQGRPIGFKTDPRGLDMDKLLDRVYAPAPPAVKYEKVVWALQESARILQREGLKAEHDYILRELLPEVGK